MGTRCTAVMAVAVAGLFVAAGTASAQVLPYGPMLYRVTATQTLPGGGTISGTVEFSSLDGNYNSDPNNPTGHDGFWDGYDRYVWTMSIPGGVPILGPAGEFLGRINSAFIEVDADPFVLANFNVTAGGLNTTFNITSGSLIVAPALYTGTASAQVTLQDNDGDGALLSFSTNPAGMYSAYYNGLTTFTNLLPNPVVAAPFSGAIDNGNFGPAAIVPFVSDISAEFNFTLSANDTATGTSNFTIVPTPGGLALIGLGTLVATRRRRSH